MNRGWREWTKWPTAVSSFSGNAEAAHAPRGELLDATVEELHADGLLVMPREDPVEM